MEAIDCQEITVGGNISVKVEQLCSDLILVSYQHPRNKLFQGILLDSTKKSFPCGVYCKSDDHDVANKVVASSESNDRFFSVSQRHTFQNSESILKRDVMHKTYSRKPMTVRLRPRQVLCSNCQSICNERSENIGPMKSSKSIVSSLISNLHYCSTENNRETRQSVLGNKIGSKQKDSKYLNGRSPKRSAVLVPKLRKLRASDIANATNIDVKSFISGTEASLEESGRLPAEGASESQDKLPTLKLSSNSQGLIWRKRKCRLPTMIVSVNNNNEQNKKYELRKRSRMSIDDSGTNNPLDLHIKVNTTDQVTPVCSEQDQENESAVRMESSWGDNEVIKDELPSKLPDFNGDQKLPNHERVIVRVGQELVESNCEISHPIEKIEKMNLRKKRSIGSMEDLWDETVFEELKKVEGDTDAIMNDCIESADPSNDRPKTTPILKISFGPGKGTVLKIPARSTVIDSINEDEQIASGSIKKEKLLISKAARKALKRARKEALKKSSVGISLSLLNGKGAHSPMRLGGFSPGRFGSASPVRFGNASPRRFGNTSPGRFGGSSPARFAVSSPLGAMQSPRASNDSVVNIQSKRHKHKVKHKKKHKEEKRRKSSDENVEPNNFNVDIPLCKEEIEPLTESTNVNIECSPEKTGDSGWKLPNSPQQLIHSPTSPKPSKVHNARQKLSISIKRVNNASYVTCDPSIENEDSEAQVVNKFSGVEVASRDRDKKSPCGDQSNVLNISPEREWGSDHSQSGDELVDVPDFPCVVPEQPESMMRMNLSWQEESHHTPGWNIKEGDIVWGKIPHFPWWPAKMIFNRRKGGPYLEAVQQASFDAQQNLETTDQPMNICESPITASPREVDVVS